MNWIEISTKFNWTDIDRECGNSYQCFYDYAVSLNRQYGAYAKYYLDDIVNIKSNNLKKGPSSFHLHLRGWIIIIIIRSKADWVGLAVISLGCNELWWEVQPRVKTLQKLKYKSKKSIKN